MPQDDPFSEKGSDGDFPQSMPLEEASKWADEDDFDWAEGAGLFVTPKGSTAEEGVFDLSPNLMKALVRRIPEGEPLTPQDVSMHILNSILECWSDIPADELIRAYSVVSTFFCLSKFPNFIEETIK